MTEYRHISVLKNEILQAMTPKSGGIYVDVTFGGGGHSRALLEAEPGCKVIGIDWDQESLDRVGASMQEEFGDRLKLIWGNFTHIVRLLSREHIGKIDGILADFGTSQFQIHEKPGFSFQKDTLLDMRMSPAHQKIWAADILKQASPAELEHILFEYGEEPRAKQIVRLIVEQRHTKPIRTTGELVELIEKVIPRHPGKRIHPATKTFQALRIAVNKELDNIWSLLKGSLEVLKPGGILACISFHSLEDRMVKRFLLEHPHAFETLTKKPIVSSDAEIEANPSSRSAKLRVARRLKH